MSEPQHLDISGFDDESFSVPVVDFDWEAVWNEEKEECEKSMRVAVQLSGATDMKSLLKSAFAAGVRHGRAQAKALQGEELNRGRKEGVGFFVRILQWADGLGRGGFGGMAVRMAGAQFLFNPDYENETQAALLKRYGITSKQLLNRELSHFRDEFGQQDPRFYSEAARAAYSRRFQAKPAAGDSAEAESFGAGD
jgi:hypothetical protein